MAQPTAQPMAQPIPQPMRASILPASYAAQPMAIWRNLWCNKLDGSAEVSPGGEGAPPLASTSSAAARAQAISGECATRTAALRAPCERAPRLQKGERASPCPANPHWWRRCGCSRCRRTALLLFLIILLLVVALFEASSLPLVALGFVVLTVVVTPNPPRTSGGRGISCCAIGTRMARSA